MQAKGSEDQAREWARDTVREYLKDRPLIYTRTEFGRGETDYVSIYVVDAGHIVNLTYRVAKAAGLKMTERGIKFGGAQYNKGLEAFGWACKVAGIPEDQGKWEELR